MKKQKFDNTETQLITMFKKAIKESRDSHNHLCQFSDEDIKGLKDLASMARESKSALKKVLVKVIFVGIGLGIIAILGDKAKAIAMSLYNIF